MSQKSPSPLRNRKFAWFWAGQTATIAGNGIFRVALPLEVLRLTGNPLDLALVLAMDQIPTVLFLLVGGALVDRLSRRMVMLVSDFINGLTVLTVAAFILTDTNQLAYLVILAFVNGVAVAMYMPASNAFVPEILPPAMLAAGNSLWSLSQSLGNFLFGPLVGGVVVAVVGTGWAFGIDGFTFLASAACLMLIRHVAPKAAEGTSIVEEIKTGLRYSIERRWLWWNMIAVGLANLFAFLPIFVVIPLLVTDHFKAGSVALGVVYGASGVGGTLVSVYLQRRTPKNILAAMWVALSIAAVSVSLLGAAPALWLAVIFSGTLWGGVTYGNILWFTTLQERIPSALLGRIISLDLLLSVALGPLAFFLGGFGVELMGPQLTLIVGGAIGLAAGVVAFVPRVLEPDPAPQPEVSPEQEAERTAEVTA